VGRYVITGRYSRALLRDVLWALLRGIIAGRYISALLRGVIAGRYCVA
jgi:hypothetical protein